MRATSIWRDADMMSARPARGSRGLRARGRSGLSLVELLAAMVVLLVGVYAVAALFPKLFLNVQEEEMRTTVMRLTEQTAERYQSGVDQAPGATAPAIDPVSGLLREVDPASKPQDPDSTSFAANPLNSRDDFVCVYEERFKVPAPPSAGAYPFYVPKGGPIAQSEMPSIVQLRALKMAIDDPGPAGSPPAGQFYLRDTGEILAGFNANKGWPSPNWLEVDYNWLDDAGTPSVTDDLIKMVSGEVVAVGATVQAARTAGNNGRDGQVIPSSARAYAVYRWWGNSGSSPPVYPVTREFVVDAVAGQRICLPQDAAGVELRMSYRARHTGGSNVRRDLIMHEDLVLPPPDPAGGALRSIHLSFGKLDDTKPLMTHTWTGTPLAATFYLLIVDLTDGYTFFWNSAGAGAPIDHVDFAQGIIWVDPAQYSGRAGNRVRIYYRTLDQHCITLQRAPSQFVEVATTITPDTPNWAHRVFKIAKDGTDNYTGSGIHTLLYDFPLYCEDQTVQVDYLVHELSGFPPKRVSNEMHVIKDIGSTASDAGLPAANPSFGFVLNQPHVAGVLAVRGTSMRVCGWWRTEGGRVSRVDTTNILFEGLL